MKVLNPLKFLYTRLKDVTQSCSVGTTIVVIVAVASDRSH